MTYLLGWVIRSNRLLSEVDGGSQTDLDTEIFLAFSVLWCVQWKDFQQA